MIAVNPLTITTPATATTNENVALNFPGPLAISVADSAIGTGSDTVSLSATVGTLTLGTTTNLIFAGTNGTVGFSVTGTLAELNAALATLTYTPDFDVFGTDELTIKIADPDGLSAMKTVGLTINPPPQITAPLNATVGENLVLSFTGTSAISVSDSVAGSTGTDSLTLIVTHGTLTLGSTSGLTFTPPGTNGTASITVTGTVSALNAALASLTYSPTANFFGSALLTISITDSGDVLNQTASVTLAVDPPPVVTAPSTANTNKNFPLLFPFGAITISDSVPGSSGTDSLTLTVTNGTLSLGTTNGLTITGNGTDSITATGTVVSLNAALSALTYTPTSGFTGSASLTISVTDPIDDLTSNLATVALAVNGPPVVTAPLSVVVAENSFLIFSGLNAITLTDPPAGSSGLDQLTLLVSRGTLTLGSLTGLTFEPGTANDTNTIIVTGTVNNLNLALNNLTYTPTPGFPGSDTLTIVVTDQTDLLTNVVTTVGLTIDPPPTIAAPQSTIFVAENSTQTFTGTNAISVADSVAGTSGIDSLTLTVTHGTLSLGTMSGLTVTGNGTNLITASGTISNLDAALASLTYTPTMNFIGPAVLTISLSDPTDGLTSVLTTVNLTVDPPPTITAPSNVFVAQSESVTFAAPNTITVADSVAGSTGIDSLTLTVTHGTLSLVATGGLTSLSGNGTNSITATGTISNLNTALASLTYTPTTGYTGTASLTVVITDVADTLSKTATVGLTINPLPVITVPATAATNENSSLTFSGLPNSIFVSDSAAGSSTESLTLLVGEGTLSMGTSTGVSISGSGLDSMTVAGTLSNLDAALTGLTYTPTSNYTGLDLLKIGVTDMGDTLGTSTSISLTINARPAVTAPSTATTNGNVALTFSGPDAITVADSEAGSNAESLTLSVSDGTLKLGSTSGLTFTSGANNSAAMTVSGTLMNLNAALAGLTDTPKTGYTGSDSLTISLTDSGDHLSAMASVGLTISGPSPAIITAPATATATTNESVSVVFSGANAISIADSAAGNSGTDSLTLSVGDGTLTLQTTTGLTFTPPGTNGTDSITVTGTVSALNAALAGLTYAPSGTGSDMLTISVTDLTDSLTASNSVKLTINAPPKITAPLSALAVENTVLSFSGSNAISVTDSAAGSNTDSLTLAVSDGTLTLGSTTGLTFTGGANGSASMTVAGTLSSLIAGLTGLTYTPTNRYTGPDSLTVAITDPGDSLNASTSVGLTVNASPAITAPVTATANENVALTFSGSNAISVIDAAAGSNSDSLTLSVGDGTLTLGSTTGLTFTSGANGAASMSVTGTVSNLDTALAGLTYTPNSRYTGSDSLKFSITDPSDGLSAATSVGLKINADSAPTITAASTAILAENSTLVFAGVNAITVADSAAGSNADSLTLSVNVGTLTLGSTSGLTFTTGGNGTGSMTVTGSVSNLNAALAGLTYTPKTGYTGSDSLTISITDPGDGLTTTSSVGLTIDAAPKITAPSSILLAENSLLTFSGSNAISVADSVAGSNPDTLTLTVSEGTLTLGSTASLTIISGANDSPSITVTGKLINLNAALATLTYTPNSGYTGMDSLTIAITDSGDSLNASASVNLTMNALPVITAPAAAATTENVALTLSGANAISMVDAAAGSNADSLTLSVSDGTLTLGSTSGLTFTAGANGTASMSVTGTLSNLNAALVGLSYSPNVRFTGPDFLKVSIIDPGDSLSASTSVTLTVNPDSVPAITAPATATTNENVPLTFSGANAISVADTAVTSTADSLTLSVDVGTLKLGSTSGLTFTAGANQTASMTVTGTIGNLDAALVGLTYTSTSGYAGSDALTISLADPGDALSNSTSVGLTINAPPVITAPATGSMEENFSLVFSGANAISVADTAAGGNADSLTLSVGDGTLILGSTSGLTFTAGASGDASMTVTGTITNLNAALAGLTYVPGNNFSGGDSLTIGITDPGDTLTASTSVTLTVIDPPPPTITAPATATTNENSSLTFSGSNAISVADSEAGSNADSLKLSVSDGALTLGSTSGLTVAAGANGSASMTVTGTLGNLDAALAGLTYTPKTGYSGSDSLAISIADAGDHLSAATSVSLTVKDPTPPTITAPSTATTIENTAFVFSGTNAITMSDSGVGNADSLKLSVSDGTLTLGSTSGLTFTAGTNGSASMTVTGTVSNLNAALAGLTYTPKTGYSGSDSLTMSITDPGDSLSGSASVKLTVSAFVAPKFTASSSASLNEDSSLVFSGSNAISVADSDSGSNADSLTLTVSHGTLTLGSTSGLTFTSGTNGSASITVTGTVSNLNAALAGLTYTPKAGYSGSDSLKISITDPFDKLTASATVALTVSVPASQPTVTVKTPDTTSVPGEPVPLVIVVSDTNAAAQAASFSFTISFGDGTSTTTSSGSPLLVNHVYTRTGTFTVSVTATDEFGHKSAAATLTIKVVPVAVETNPFNTSQTALFVGGTTGNDTVSFAASGKSITVKLNGVSEGTFSTSGPLIIFGQGGKDTYSEGAGVTNAVDLLAGATADNVETDLDNEALQWAGLTAAVEILNA